MNAKVVNCLLVMALMISASDAAGDNNVDQNKEPSIPKNKKQLKGILTNNTKVVVMFSANWNGTMQNLNRSIMPTFEELRTSEKFSGIKFLKLDVDEFPLNFEDFGVRAIPFFVFFLDGNKIGEVVGANAGALKNKMEELNEMK